MPLPLMKRGKSFLGDRLGLPTRTLFALETALRDLIQSFVVDESIVRMRRRHLQTHLTIRVSA